MKKLVVLLALGLFINNAVFAQTKFAWIDSRELLKAMPEVTKADADLQAFAKQYQDQLQTMQAEYEKKIKEYQAGEKTMTDAVKEVKEKEIRDLQGRMESTNQSAQEKVEKKKQELYQPILEKADKAIKDVAKEKAIDYVFDVSLGSLLVIKDADNMLPAVKTKLGLK
ncbi:MAG: OmpH family outer membrane protein [Bacteroidetes bacterium]|nr:OmpH family outer membrane protein [Bacteroidota bacterium]